jgi:hypothetical protein
MASPHNPLGSSEEWSTGFFESSFESAFRQKGLPLRLDDGSIPYSYKPKSDTTHFSDNALAISTLRLSLVAVAEHSQFARFSLHACLVIGSLVSSLFNSLAHACTNGQP